MSKLSKREVKTRIETLKSMDTIIWNYGDDEYTDTWITFGVPDACDIDMYTEIAKDDEIYSDIFNLFTALIKCMNKDMLHDRR